MLGSQVPVRRLTVEPDTGVAKAAELVRRRIVTPARQLPFEVGDSPRHIVETALLFFIEAMKDRPRRQIAPGDGGQDFGMREAMGDAPLHRADVLEEPLGQKLLEFPRRRDVGRKLVKRPHDRWRHCRVQTRPDRRARERFEELLDLRPRAGRRRVGVRPPGRRHGRQEIDLVDDVFIDFGLGKVETQEVKRDLFVLGPHLLEESAHEGGRDLPVYIAHLGGDGVQPRVEIPDQRFDGLGRSRVDLGGDGAHFVIERVEVQRVAGLGREERLVDAPEKLVESPKGLEPLRQADVVFVQKLDSLN